MGYDLSSRVGFRGLIEDGVDEAITDGLRISRKKIEGHYYGWIGNFHDSLKYEKNARRLRKLRKMGYSIRIFHIKGIGPDRKVGILTVYARRN